MSPLATYQLPWQIRFADTDAYGFAHFSSYLRMMEETEYAFLRARGLHVVFYDERGTLGFPRLQTRINIIRALAFEQKTVVHLSLTEFDGKQMTFEFDIVDEHLATAIEGKFVVACCRFPDNQPPYAVLIPSYVEAALTG